MAPDAIERWLMYAREVTAFRASIDSDYGTYERLKGEFVRLFPTASSEQYEHAMRQIARMTGV